MQNKKISKKIVSLIVAGGFVLSFGANVIASAGDTSTSQSSASQVVKMDQPSGQKCHGPGMGDQTMLNDLVKKGVISQAQATKWAEYAKNENAARKAEMEKVKNMTAAEREAYFAKMRKERPNPLSNVVKAGIISQAQADKIAKLMPARHAGKGHGAMMDAKTQTGNLVSKGIISQEQADKWVKYEQSKAAARKAEMEKVKNMTAAERDAYFAKMKEERPEPLSNVVKAGIITQAQADQILKLLPAKH